MNEQEAAQALMSAHSDIVAATADLIGPAETAQILRALADLIEQCAIPKEKMH